MDVAIFPFFFISIQIIFVFLVKQQNNTKILNYRVKKQIVKTCKIGYNWIFTTKIFLKTDEKR